jgi:glycosyltransferase involved in cell wall biosynthesis
MRDLLAGRGVPQQKMSVIGPWSDDFTGQMRMGASEARKQNNLHDLFTVMYLGYAGAWHEFDPILAAIPEIIKSHPIQFVFVGLGPGIDRVAAQKAKNCWDQVIIKDWVPRDMLRVLPSCGDIHLVSLKENMLGTCSPSKTYSSMAFERPIVFLGPPSCQAAIDIKEAQAGEIVGNKEELINAIKKLFADRELLKSYGKNSRDAFLNKHSASVNLALWDTELSQVQAGH